jgi:hypothetical protein
MYFVRPTSPISIIGIAIYYFMVHRRRFPIFCITGAVWLALFIAYSMNIWGEFIPPYFSTKRLSLSYFHIAITGNLISPGRGLLIYVPTVMIVVYLLIKKRRILPEKGLVLVGVSCILAQYMVNCFYPHWYGGHSYGSRLMTDVVPWMFLLGVLGISRWRRSGSIPEDSKGRIVPKIESALFITLLCISVFMNGCGAVSKKASRWNIYPVDIKVSNERLWDWSDPPFFRCFKESVR